MIHGLHSKEYKNGLKPWDCGRMKREKREMIWLKFTRRFVDSATSPSIFFEFRNNRITGGHSHMTYKLASIQDVQLHFSSTKLCIEGPQESVTATRIGMFQRRLSDILLHGHIVRHPRQLQFVQFIRGVHPRAYLGSRGVTTLMSCQWVTYQKCGHHFAIALIMNSRLLLNIFAWVKTTDFIENLKKHLKWKSHRIFCCYAQVTCLFMATNHWVKYGYCSSWEILPLTMVTIDQSGEKRLSNL